MRAGFDASAAAKAQRTGVGRYAAELLDAMSVLAARGEEDVRVVAGVRFSRWRRWRHRWRPPAAARGVAVTRFFSETLLRPCLGPLDVFHGLDARVPAKSRLPLVATLHDVAPAVAAGIASEDFAQRKRAAYAGLAARATRIVCVSAATRDAFRALHAVEPERFAVVHHGLDPRFLQRGSAGAGASSAECEALAALGVRAPYVLFVGLLSARKNLAPLARAFDRLAASRPKLRLVLAGGRAHGFEELEAKLRETAHRDRIVLPGFVPDALLPALYAGARAFVFPSVVEGFGMPMLEAMACGVPVVAADVPVTTEVAGDAAERVDTRDAGALCAALEPLLDDGNRRAALVERGLARAAGFTWDEAARKTLRVLRDAVAAGARP